MDFNKLRSPVFICKTAIVVLGFLILIIGCVSHFQSTWNKKQCLLVGNEQFCGRMRDNICDTLKAAVNKPCPSLSMERYFVAMIIICFFLSLGTLAATFVMNPNSETLKYVDLGYHAISAFLLFIAAIVYFVSANQINKYSLYIVGDVNFRRSEKLAAASLTIIQTFLYATTALLLTRSNVVMPSY